MAPSLSRRSLTKTDAPVCQYHGFLQGRLTPCHGVALRRRTPPCTPRALCVLAEVVAAWLLCVFCRGGSRRPPAPPAPAKRVLYWRSGLLCVLVVWFMCRKSSPAAAFSGDSRDLICATLATAGEVSPDPSRRRATLAGFSGILQKSGNFSKIIARFLLF